MKKWIVTGIVLAGLGLSGWQIIEKASQTRKESQRQRSDIPVAVGKVSFYCLKQGISEELL